MQLDTEGALRAAIERGDIRENRHIEVKRETPKTKSARLEIARDFASFAMDGGVILFGVEEADGDQLGLSPFDLANETERLEGIAANRIEPPLPIRVYPIESTAAGKGYLYVDIAPSPFAPHMVDGVYWARGERTKRRLGDAEVVRLHFNRERAEDRVSEALREELARDPDEGDWRLFVVAEPLTAARDIASKFTKLEPAAVMRLGANADLPDSIARYTDELRPRGGVVRRSNGVAWTNMAAGRTVADSSQATWATDIEVRSSGAIRVLASSIVFEHRHPRLPDARRYISPASALSWTHHAVQLAKDLSNEIGYGGQWAFGVHAYGLRGATAYTEDWSIARLPVFDADDYRRITTASRVEIEDDPNSIVARLMGDFVLASGLYALHTDALDPRPRSDPDADDT